MPFVFLTFFILSYVQVFSQHENHTTRIEATTTPKSPRVAVMEMVGNNHVHLDYSSPSVRGRYIWNGLVAYGQVWAAGAHKASWIEFSEDVKINSQRIPKGKYGFFAIPDKQEWTIILNNDWDMHLADNYKQENDLLRFKVKPKLSKTITEALTYTVKSLDNKRGQLSLSWEYLSISFNFENCN